MVLLHIAPAAHSVRKKQRNATPTPSLLRPAHAHGRVCRLVAGRCSPRALPPLQGRLQRGTHTLPGIQLPTRQALQRQAIQAAEGEHRGIGEELRPTELTQ